MSKTIDLVPNNTDTKFIFEHAKQRKALKNKEKTRSFNSYGFFCILERVRGIEPPYSAWEADVLPLNYTRISYIITPNCTLGKSGHWRMMDYA